MMNSFHHTLLSHFCNKEVLVVLQCKISPKSNCYHSLWPFPFIAILFSINYTPLLNWAIGSTQWTNTFELRILKYCIKIIKNATLPNHLGLPEAICQPANQYQPSCQFLVDRLVLVGWQMASFISFLIYFNILGTNGLVHWIEPIAQFRRSVYSIY